MKEKLIHEDSKLMLRITVTLSIIFFLIATADFFFSSKRVLFYPTLVVLIYNVSMLFNLKSTHIENLKFIDTILLIIYFSFLTHYFFLDLYFVPVFCILLLYIFASFNNYRKFILISLIIVCITLLLFLFREQNNTYRSSNDNSLYIGYLRATSSLAIGVIFYFMIDFWIKTKRFNNENIPITQSENDSLTELSELLECIKRKNNSFMPLFLSTNIVFVNKIKDRCPKINETELEVCALIKLGLSTKEIAVATNSTYKSIESLKYRIRKKMNLESSTSMVFFFNEI